MILEVAGAKPTFREALRVWLHVGLNSFGGPAGQIAVLHRELVERRRWLSEERFLHALDLCMLLPGPEAQQLAVYSGWLLHGVRGGLAAGLLFVAPGALAMLALCLVYVEARDLSWFQALFVGVKAAVVALVAGAMWHIARRALKTPAACILAALAFVATWVFHLAFPIVVAFAVAIGFLLERARPGSLRPRQPTEPVETDAPAPSLARSLRTLSTGLAIWLVPVGAVVVLDPGGGVQGAMARFFTGASMVTFGGAYAALAYTAEHAASAQGWLSAREMADGLGLAESTPGPLILVLQFVAFVGAHHHPGQLAPTAAGIAASFVMLWATFAPCFLWIFLCAPWMERARASRSLSAALAAVTAAAVGVILDLALWFATHVLFAHVHAVEVGGGRVDAPEWSTFQPAAIVTAVLAAFLLFHRRWPLLAVLATCAAAGLAARAIG